MLSYVKGPDAQLLELTVDEAFQRTVKRLGNHLALVVSRQGQRLSWRELDLRVEATARGLAGLGLRPGDRVGVWSTNNLEWILLQLATARLGLVLINVNPAYRSWELKYVLEKSGMKALFLLERDARANYREILARALEGAVTSLEHTVFFDHDSWNRMLAEGRDYVLPVLSSSQVVNIQYTSGTTGSPKGVLLTHRNLVNNAWLIAQRLRLTEADRLCSPVPLYHCFGCVMSSLLCFVTGATLILPAPQFDPLATLEAVHRERATALYGVPTMFIAELQQARFAEFDLTSLRTGIMAGAPCPIELMRRVIHDMHCSGMTIAYGQTESSPVITLSHPEDPIELRVGTVGCAMPATEVKIVSPQTGETLPVGQVGELCTRGYLVMKGYDGNTQATQEAIDPEGWLHTGDLAVMYENGYFGIRGRARDMIIRGGENIYPREIEDFFYTHPAVSDVAVFGVPDERLGEVVCAWVRLKPGFQATAEQLREYCRERIAHYKTPAYIRIVDEFPLTVTGKIQKFRMREAEIAARGLQGAASVETA
ncbi:MAG: AMP-binding protein [Bryobacteraceae bacterium]|nr:AMP-binding protein [Bryobacteraceae bacterium]MDW8378977.1 AMP-binding protein [Bryobacterales bacterium]